MGELEEERKEMNEGKEKQKADELFDDIPKQTESSDVIGSSNGIKSKPKSLLSGLFDFAGETVTVSKEVSADSSEAKKFLKSQQDSEESRPSEVATGGVKRSGLAGIVGSIGKKQKMGVLDKSKLDWNSFVTQEGISEELKTHNKGKEGYVEKQMFLERADLRQFELEKAVRDKNRKS